MAFSLTNPSRGRVLVTGASGFVGHAVMDRLAALGNDAVGLSRSHPADAATRAWETADLLAQPVADILARHRPDVIIHCAGRGGEPGSARERAQCWASNVTLTERLLDAAAQQTAPPRVVLVSSAAIYGPMAPGQDALDETACWRPAGYYGAAKAAATMLADAMNRRGDLPVVIAVPFNLIGPGQPAHLVPQDFIERLRANPDRLEVGDLSAVRDWVDVRDAASALVALADVDTPTGIYNIATGRGLSVQSVLDRVIGVMGLTPDIVVSGARKARAGVSRSVGNPSKLVEIMGSTPNYSLDESLVDMFD